MYENQDVDRIIQKCFPGNNHIKRLQKEADRLILMNKSNFKFAFYESPLGMKIIVDFSVY